MIRLLLICLAVVPGAFGGHVYGFGYPYGPIFAINAGDGSASVAYPTSVVALGASRAASAGEFYISTGINLWTGNLAGDRNPLGALNGGALDLAWDAERGILYGTDPGGLYAIDRACPATLCEATPLFGLPPLMEGITFVSGAGIYGVSNLDGLLYRVNPVTGEAFAVGPTGLPPGDGVMDLAYDPDTGMFVASVIPGLHSKVLLPYGSAIGPGMLYRIDPITGAAVVLAANFPAVAALAESVPEPSTGVLLVVAFTAVGIVKRRSLEC